MIQATRIESRGVTVGRITLDRADKKNALTPAMLDAVRARVQEMAGGDSPSVGAIVLDGNGAAFCTGFDLTLCKENSEALKVLLKGLSAAIRALRRCPVPVILAAHGAALAGGCALLGGADWVVSHNDAKIGYPVVRLGISPAVSAPFLAQAVGFGQARERLLDSALISGWDAYRIGLVHECMEDAGKVRQRALVVAEQMAARPRAAVAPTKQWLNEMDGSDDEVRADRALAASLALVGSAEERERLGQLWKA